MNNLGEMPSYMSPKPVQKRKEPPTDNTEDPPVKKKKQGRRKINIEFIDDKSRRQITFSKRKAGIMKKAYELTTLTGTQALLLIASETGHVYTFATPKLQPFVTRPDGKALIQRCLNSPDPEGAIPQDDVSNNYVPPVPAQPPPEQLVEDAIPPSMPAYVESSLVLVVGKTIPVANGFTAAHFKDLCALTDKWTQQCRHQISCLAGGYPSMDGFFRSPSDRIMAEIVVGLKVAEVDYTSPHQPSFSIEKLSSFLEEAEKIIMDNMWHDISSKPYVMDDKHWKQPQNQEYAPLPLTKTPLGLHVVSTYPNAHVNVVFGVRKQGENGKGSQVVGISCQKGVGHVCKLEIDERFHEERLQMMGGVDGVPYYHLLPDILK